MGVSYLIEPQNQLVVVRVSGAVTYEELVEQTERLRADPDFRPHYRELVVGEGGDATPETVKAFAQRPPLFDERSRRAFVVDSELAFGMVRMFQTRRGEDAGEIQVFRDLDEARAWLIDAPKIDAEQEGL